MTLHQLLLNIQEGKPVNFHLVCKKLPKTVAWQSLFMPEPVAKNKHIVSITNMAEFTLLLQQTMPPDTREKAAVHTYSSSHDVKCNSAYMLCFPSNIAGLNKRYSELAPRDLTAVAISNDNLLPLPFSQASNAILIENQDCFFGWQTLLKHYQEQIDSSDCDIYFSAGSRILNKAFADLLKSYKTINCAFDYDLAGLETSVLLHQRKYASLHYLLPTQLSQYQHLFTFRPNSTKDLAKMISLCEQLDMPELATTISQTKCFMEQEALLTLA